MYCKKCGKLLQDGAKFCPQCGEEITILKPDFNQYENIENSEYVKGEEESTEQTNSTVLTIEDNVEDEKELQNENINTSKQNERNLVSKCPSCGNDIGYMSTCPSCGYSRQSTENQSKQKDTQSPAIVFIKDWYNRRSTKEKKVVITCIIVASFILGVLFHMGVGVKSSEYQQVLESNSKLEQDNNKLQEELSNTTSEYQAYKTKMQPYEEVQLTDAKNKAEAEKLRIEQEQQAKAEKEAAEKAEAERAAAEAAAAKAAEEAKGYETGITYDQLARTPDDYQGKKVKFKGKVVQVIEGTSETQLRLAVNGDYDSILFCAVPKELTSSTRILENDNITIMGVSNGLLSYQSTMGGTITIPSVIVNDWGPN